MNKHFQYLTEEPSREFFQKVAENHLAASGIKPVGPELSRSAPDPVSFAKVAMQADRDLARLVKVANAGEEAGASRRSMAYFDAVTSRVSMDANEMASLFDKCAATGLEADISAAYQSLIDEFPEFQEKIAADLSELAFDMAEEAAFEKEAFRALAAGVGGAWKAMRARGVAAKAMRQQKKLRAVRIKTQKKLEGVRGKQHALEVAPAATGGVVRKAFSHARGQSQKAGLTARQHKLEQRLARTRQSLSGARGQRAAAVGQQRAAAGLPPVTPVARTGAQNTTATSSLPVAGTKPPTPPTTTTPSTTQGGAADAAARAAQPPKPPPTPKGEGPKAPGAAPPTTAPEAVKESPGLWASWKKWTRGEKLTPEERSGLINVGVMAYGAKEVMT